jgi:WD40 repeat protein
VTIVHKAIDRNPARRYQSAAQLGEDLGRFLRDEPILARRASGPERVLRWARQHSGTAAALAVILVLLVGTAVASTLAAWKFQNLAREKDSALVTAIRARNDADNASDLERWERYRSNVAAASVALQIQNNDFARSALDAAPLVHRDWEWRHLHSRIDVSSLVVVMPGGVSAMSLSPSGRQVAVGCFYRNEVYLFDVPTGKAGAILGGHTAPVGFLAYSPDGQILGTAAPDGTIRLWDPATGRQRAVLRGPAGEMALAYSPDGRRIGTQIGDQVHLWDTESGRLVATLAGQGFSYVADHAANDRRLPQFGSNGQFLIAGRKGELCQCDAATGKLVTVLGRFNGALRVADLSPDGKRVAVAGGENPPLPIHIWDRDSGKLWDLAHGHTDYLRSLGFSPDGSRLLSVASYPDCSPRLWDAATGRRIAVLPGHTNRIEAAAFSPDGRRLCTVSLDSTARLWDGKTGELIAILRGHTGKLARVQFSQDGRRLVTGGEDATLWLWDARTGELAAALCGHARWGIRYDGGPLFTIAPDGSFLVSASLDGTLRLWDLELLERNGIFRGHGDFVYDVAASPDGQQVASAAWDSTVRLWDASSGRQMGLLSHPGTRLESVAYGPDGRQIVTWGRPAGVTLWNKTDREWQLAWRIAEGFSDSSCRAVINGQGTLVAAGSSRGPVYLMDVASGERVAVLEGHKKSALDVAFRPDGAQLASASLDQTIRLWDTVTHQAIAVLRGHSSDVSRVAYSADGALLASGSFDMTIRFWDVATHRELAVIPIGNKVYGMAFSTDCRRLAAGCADGAIRLLDVGRRQVVAELRGHREYVHAVDWSPDGTRLISGSGDMTVRLWESPPVGERAGISHVAAAPGGAR